MPRSVLFNSPTLYRTCKNSSISEKHTKQKTVKHVYNEGPGTGNFASL